MVGGLGCAVPPRSPRILPVYLVAKRLTAFSSTPSTTLKHGCDRADANASVNTDHRKSMRFCAIDESRPEPSGASVQAQIGPLVSGHLFSPVATPPTSSSRRGVLVGGHAPGAGIVFEKPNVRSNFPVSVIFNVVSVRDQPLQESPVRLITIGSPLHMRSKGLTLLFQRMLSSFRPFIPTRDRVRIWLLRLFSVSPQVP